MNNSNTVADLLIRSGAKVNAKDEVSTVSATLMIYPTRCICVTALIMMTGLSYSTLKG